MSTKSRTLETISNTRRSNTLKSKINRTYTVNQDLVEFPSNQDLLHSFTKRNNTINSNLEMAVIPREGTCTVNPEMLEQLRSTSSNLEVAAISRVGTCSVNQEMPEQPRSTNSNPEMDLNSRIKTISANPDLVELMMSTNSQP